MISFKQFISEDKGKAFAMTYMRANPPTVGHSKVIAAVAKHPGTHRIVVSHSQDNKKNPLSGEEKADLLRTAHPEHKLREAGRSDSFHSRPLLHARFLFVYHGSR